MTIVQCLLQAQADVHQGANDGATPLFIASQNGHLTIVQCLLQAQADVNQAKKTGTTPLYIASQNGHLAVVQYLLQTQADVHQGANHGATPLYIAAQEGHLTVVQRLLEAHAKVNQACNDGATPLFIASQEGHLGVVECLLQAQADVNQACDNGATPLYIAAQQNHPACVALLLAVGAGLFVDLPELPALTDTAGKVVIGLSLDHRPVTRTTPGFEQAITTFQELDQALAKQAFLGKGPALLLKGCDALLQYGHPQAQQIRLLRAKIANLSSLASRCLYEFYANTHGQTLRQQFHQQQILLPGTLVDQLQALETTLPEPCRHRLK